MDEKELMMEYEYVRQSGKTNMFDVGAVLRLAKKFKLNLLAKLSAKEYASLLGRYRRLDAEEFKKWKKQKGLK